LLFGHFIGSLFLRDATKSRRAGTAAGAVAGSREGAGCERENARASARGEASAGPGIVKSQADVSFMSGGIGVEERTQMRQAAKSYNLGLSFAGKSRGYLTDVSVVITDDKSQPVLSAANTGPWFYFLLIPAR
jgi:hypothetical protein